MKISSCLLGVFIFIVCGWKTTFDAAGQASIQSDTQKQEAIACQDRMQNFMTPNVNHDILRFFEGQWNATISSRATPQNVMSQSEAAVEARMIMKGRYLERVLKGKGDEFEARVVNGYDNFRQEFTGVWFDNMCTGMITGSGQYDPNTRTLSEEGSMSCPMTNQGRRWYRSTTRFIDDDHYVLEMFKRDEEGDEFSAMTIEFMRAQ